MSNNENRLRELLAYHGSDISNWPSNTLPFARDALRDPRLAALIAEERQFERILMTRRAPAAAAPDFARRIIIASASRQQFPAFTGWMHEVLTEIRPTALAAMLVLGFVLGFGVMTLAPHSASTSFVQSSTEDEGAIL